MTTATKSVIVGTAGHIDHGKSSLVEALTGTHPDRLAEEKRRGITIDLGFAFLEEGEIRFGFVDVPGHERFVSNMLAGAAGIDVVLLVIAADEGIKPQTREHFDICRLLGISRGIVVLAKADLVDQETCELVRLEVEDFVRGTFLEQAAILAVSVKIGEGLSRLKEELLRLGREIPGKDPSRNLRLPIDRSFAIKGFGTVVTGTLVSGSVAAGDEVELLPRAERLRVRCVQTGGKAVLRALAGQRTAVNLSGIEHAEIKRGMVLATPGRFHASRRIDVKLELLENAPKIRQRSRVHFHAGTAETVGEVLLHGCDELVSGGTAFAQLRLQDPVLLLLGDRFIVRQFSPVITIGGGKVLDPLARRPLKRDTDRGSFLATLEKGNRENILQAMTEHSRFGLSVADITVRTDWADQEIREAVQNLADSRQVRLISSEPLLLLAATSFEGIRGRLLDRVERFHKENALSPGMQREDLRASLCQRLRPEIFRAALGELIAEKKLEVSGELVKRAGAEIALLPEEARSKEQMEAAFANAGLAVPSLKEVLTQLPVEPKRAEKLLHLLLREKSLVRISAELVFHQRALQELRQRLSGYKKAKGERISVSGFKELTGISRKYAIPLLEYLDRERVTRRVGDERVIL
jgi:selenocysteine-specific elongation factor